MSNRNHLGTPELVHRVRPNQCFACQAMLDDVTAQFCPKCGEPTFPPSLLTGGRFVPKRRLGRGGMGVVYLVEDQVLETNRALKVLTLPSEISDDERTRLRLRLIQEARASQWLCARSHHVVQVFDIGVSPEENMPYIVMECLDGKTLTDRLKAGPFDLAETIRIARQVCSALSHAHRKNMVHRDLKPDNLMLVTMDGEQDFVKILDFGLVKMQDSAIHTESGSTLGTLNYMAPEQLGGATIQPSADVFALGAIMYECLTGIRANPGQTTTDCMAVLLDRGPRPVDELGLDIPSDFATLVNDCLNLDPDRRPQNADMVNDRLREVATACPGTLQPEDDASKTPELTISNSIPDQDASLSRSEILTEIEPMTNAATPVITTHNAGSIGRTPWRLLAGVVLVCGAVLAFKALDPVSSLGPDQILRPMPIETEEVPSTRRVDLPNIDPSAENPTADDEPVQTADQPMDSKHEDTPSKNRTTLPETFNVDTDLTPTNVKLRGDTPLGRRAAAIAQLALSGIKDVPPQQRWRALAPSTRQWLQTNFQSMLPASMPDPFELNRSTWSAWKAVAPKTVRLPRLGRLLVNERDEAVFETVNCGQLSDGDRLVTAESTIRGYSPQRCLSGACATRLASILRKARQAGERVRLKFTVQQAYHGRHDSNDFHSGCVIHP
ncbi:MAG: protein kinase [Myxococcota bacterium]|nr:protein kinase [Myxococcota bacterium]